MQRTAITGAPQVGKSCLLRALGASSNDKKHTHTVYSLHDDLLVRLANAEGSTEVTPVKLSFEEIEGQSFSSMRNCDCIVLVVKPRQASQVTWIAREVMGEARQWLLDATLEDMAVVEGALAKLKKSAKTGDRRAADTVQASETLLSLLESQNFKEALALSRDVQHIPKEWGLLCSKPRILVVNLPEEFACNRSEIQLALSELSEAFSATEASPLDLEAELRELADSDPESAAEMAASYCVEEPIASRLASAVLEALGLIIFYTANANEARAWTLPRGATVLEAAGSIHSDMERGFIRAEVIGADHLIATGSLKEARKKGVVRIEGKSYVVQPKDVIYVRFNV